METFKEIKKSFFNNYINDLHIDIELKERLTSTKQGDLDFYDIFPFLFIDSFELSENDNRISYLSISTYLYYIYVTTNDKFIDSNYINFLLNYKIINFTNEESLKILGNLFNKENEFWKNWYNRKTMYYEAIDLEKNNKTVTIKQYFKLGIYKSSLALATLDALYSLSNYKNFNKYNNLIKSLNYFAISTQIIDDLQDVEEDINQNQYNFFVFMINNEITEKEKLNAKNYKKKLYLKKIPLEFYKKAQFFYRKAYFHALEADAVTWSKVVNYQLNKNKNRIDTLEGFYLIREFKISLLSKDKLLFNHINLSKVPALYLKALNTILNDYKNNFVETSHIMYLSKLEGFDNKSELLLGLIFPLSLITDLLIDISKSLEIDLDEYINYSLKLIKKKKLKSGIKAWNYFSEINEIAPDIDDFGQILRVLIKKSEFNYIKKHCHSIIKFSIKYCLSKEKVFYTWLIPIDNKTDFQIKQTIFNEKWGVGPDVEVVANYINSLILLDNKNYDNLLEINVNWLKGNQNKLGYWASKWYYDVYYSTYICALVFCSDKFRDDEVLSNVSNFLAQNQNMDGGWGKIKSNSLNTSFAIITLKNIDRKRHFDIINKAEIFLKNNQDINGNWESVNFIKPRINDPYRSKIITNAFALKALLM